MELLIAAVAGIAFGAVAHFFIAKPADRLGPLLLPAVGGATAMAGWVVALWLGRLLQTPWLSPTEPATWVIVALITAGVVIALARMLPLRRAADDKDLFDRLSHVGRADL